MIENVAECACANEESADASPPFHSFARALSFQPNPLILRQPSDRRLFAAEAAASLWMMRAAECDRRLHSLDEITSRLNSNIEGRNNQRRHATEINSAGLPRTPFLSELLHPPFPRLYCSIVKTNFHIACPFFSTSSFKFAIARHVRMHHPTLRLQAKACTRACTCTCKCRSRAISIMKDQRRSRALYEVALL